MPPDGAKIPGARPSFVSSPQLPVLKSQPRKIDEAALTAMRQAILTSEPYEEDFVNLTEIGQKLGRISPDLKA